MVLGLVTLRSTEVGAVSVAWLVVSLPPSSFRHALLLVTQLTTVYHTTVEPLYNAPLYNAEPLYNAVFSRKFFHPECF